MRMSRARMRPAMDHAPPPTRGEELSIFLLLAQTLTQATKIPEATKVRL